jgi:hypothetical protein
MSSCVGIEVLIAVVMKSSIFWDIGPCIPLKPIWRFGGTYRLHFSRERNQREEGRHNSILKIRATCSSIRRWPSRDYSVLNPKGYNYSHIHLMIKLSLCLTNYILYYEDVWRSGYRDLRILELDISWRRMLNFTPRPLYPRGKSPLYPLDRRLGGPQSRSERRGESSWPYWDSNSVTYYVIHYPAL